MTGQADRTSHTSARRLPDATWHERAHGELTLGERAADRMRDALGSWRFVGLFVLVMIVWALVNSGFQGWDPYPFILLNLFLSMLAGLQGAILLIAARRQDAIAAALSQHDFETNVAAAIDIEALLLINREQLAMIQLILAGQSVRSEEAPPAPAIARAAVRPYSISEAQPDFDL